MIGRLSKHVLSFVGAVITMASLLSLIISEPVRTWVKTNSYSVFIILVVVVAVAFISLDYILHIKNSTPTTHDRSVVAKFLEDLPPSSNVIAWLRYSYSPKSARVANLDVIDGALRDMEVNLVGLDNRKANNAYRRLEGTMSEFRDTVSLNLFMDDEYKWMKISGQWPWKQQEQLMNQLMTMRGKLISSYDSFIRTCHDGKLD